MLSVRVTYINRFCRFHHADYLNPNALSGAISVNVFDCVDLEETFWLGEVKIPLSALTRGLNVGFDFVVCKKALTSVSLAVWLV